MVGIGAISTQLAVSSTKISKCESIPRMGFEGRNPNSLFYKTNSTAGISCTFPFHSSLNADERFHIHFIPKASFSPVGSAEFTEEPATGVKFQKSLGLPSCSDTLSLLGTGHREKVFVLIGVEVYAAGLYANPSIISKLNAWKGRSYSEIQEDSSLFVAIFQAPLEKALQIILVRDVDGKTFWEALDDSVSPRIKAPTTADESALSTFRSIFQSRSLKKGTLIFLTWLNPSKMLVCISSDGIPSTVDATIESENVALAFFDVFFGDSSVTPSLKSSVANGLAMALK